MEYRKFGRSGLTVPVLSFGTATFGGGNEFFKAWGNTDVAEAKSLIDVCLDAGLNFFDTANVYSNGASESILGEAIKGKRSRTLISTKAVFPMGDDANQTGASRYNLTQSVEASLKRLQTDYIDVFHLHGFDANTPLEETLRTLDDLVKSGKVRYLACSNYSSWHLMKALAISEKQNLERFVGHQLYYSLVGRDAEHDLIPLGLDQGVGSMVWSPLAGGALSGKIRRNQAPPKDSRLGQISFVPYNEALLFNVVDVLDSIAKERGKTIPQVALNWILRKPTISNIIVGARNAEQLKQNLGAIGWKLTDEEVARLDAVSAAPIPYPNWHQNGFPQLLKKLPSVAW